MRFKLEKERQWDHQVFGFEYDKKEINRAIRFKEQYPYTNPLYPLIELKFDKTRCVEELKKYNVELPMMYRLGYTNNNCVGCVKGGMGYWNKIRVDFPEVFKQVAEVERKVNATCLMDTVNGKRVRLFLDELDPERGRTEPPITSECGVICATEFNDIDHPKLNDILTGKFNIDDV